MFYSFYWHGFCLGKMVLIYMFYYRSFLNIVNEQALVQQPACAHALKDMQLWKFLTFWNWLLIEVRNLCGQSGRLSGKIFCTISVEDFRKLLIFLIENYPFELFLSGKFTVLFCWMHNSLLSVWTLSLADVLHSFSTILLKVSIICKLSWIFGELDVLART